MLLALVALAATAQLASVAKEDSILVSLRKNVILTVDDIPDPRPYGMRIADNASIIDTWSSTSIAMSIKRIEWGIRGSQVVVVTVDKICAELFNPKTSSRGEVCNPKQFATKLFNLWKIGSAQYENGVLVLVVKGARRIEIEAGNGVDHLLTKSWCTSMLERYAVPKFRNGDYGGGLAVAVMQIGRKMRQEGELPGYGSLSHPYGVYGPSTTTVTHSSSDLDQFKFGAGLMSVYGVIVGAQYLFENNIGTRSCPKCRSRVPGRLLSAWEPRLPATHLWRGLEQCDFTCQKCGYNGQFSKWIRQYDGVRYDSLDTERRNPHYYYSGGGGDSSSSSSSGGGSSGGGGGASW